LPISPGFHGINHKPFLCFKNWMMIKQPI
jgi:hypothetical protein